MESWPLFDRWQDQHVLVWDEPRKNIHERKKIFILKVKQLMLLPRHWAPFAWKFTGKKPSQHYILYLARAMSNSVSIGANNVCGGKNRREEFVSREERVESAQSSIQQQAKF